MMFFKCSWEAISLEEPLCTCCGMVEHLGVGTAAASTSVNSCTLPKHLLAQEGCPQMWTADRLLHAILLAPGMGGNLFCYGQGLAASGTTHIPDCV